MCSLSVALSLSFPLLPPITLFRTSFEWMFHINDIVKIYMQIDCQAVPPWQQWLHCTTTSRQEREKRQIKRDNQTNPTKAQQLSGSTYKISETEVFVAHATTHIYCEAIIIMIIIFCLNYRFTQHSPLRERPHYSFFFGDVIACLIRKILWHVFAIAREKIHTHIHVADENIN